MTNIKFYPLPDGQFVVSYFDELRRTRIQEAFTDERKAKDFYTGLKSRRPVREQKRSLKNCTIEELMEVFIEEMPDATLNKAPQLIRDFLDSFALFKIEDLDEARLRSFYMRQKLENDYTNHSLSTRKYQIQGFFKWLITRGIVEVSPQETIRMGKSKQFRRKPVHLRPEKFEEVIARAREFSPGLIYPILLLMNDTAAKTGDVVTLKWSDIDFKNKRVRLPGYVKVQPRENAISEATVAALKRVDSGGEMVFTNLEGRPTRKDLLMKELKGFQKRAGLVSDWYFRDLRHSFAVNFMQSGGRIERLQKILGHWHPRLTEELYGSFRINSVDPMDFEGVPGTGDFSSETDKF